MALRDIADVDPRYIEVARLRTLEGMTWEEIAVEMDVDDKTIYNWRQTPMWQGAVWAMLTTHAGHILEIAVRRLAQSAKGEPGSPGVTAANSLLDRVMGAVTQKHGTEPGKPLEVNVALAGTILSDPDARAAASRLFERLALATAVPRGPSDDDDEREMDASATPA